MPTASPFKTAPSPEQPPPRPWTRADAIALSYAQCAKCNGIGLQLRRNGEVEPCNCVLRGIFRICFNHYRELVRQDGYLSQVVLSPETFDDQQSTHQGKQRAYGRPNEEFVADFHLVSKRSLTVDEWRIFRFHFLLGGDSKLCCKRLGIDRGTFFHEVYRIEQKLGRVYRDLQPYALFPLDQYFQPCRRKRLERA